MSARVSLYWIALAVALLVACSGCNKGGVSPTGEGAPPVAASPSGAATATASAASDSTSATAAPPSGQAQSGSGSSGGGSGSGNSGGGSGSGNSGGGSGNSGGGGAEGAPVHIPAVVLTIGNDLQMEYNAVVGAATDKCGGTLCVSVSKAGTGYECGSTVTVNGSQITPDTTTDSQGNEFIIVPRGASIVINGNALGQESLACPSDQPAVTVASDWFSAGKPIGGQGDGGAFDDATAAIAAACGDGSSCVTLKVTGGPSLCNVEPQPGDPANIPVGGSTDIKVLRGGTITLDGDADGSFTNCPSGN